MAYSQYNRRRFEGEKPVNEGETYDIAIDATGAKGDGIGKVKGFVVIVPNAKPGQTVKVKIDAVRGKVAFGTLVGDAEAAPAEEVSEETPEGEKAEEPAAEETAEEPAEDDAVESEEAAEEEPAEKEAAEEEPAAEEAAEEAPAKEEAASEEPAAEESKKEKKK